MSPADPHAVRTRLDRTGYDPHLLVNEQPFIVLGGELHNSSASSPRAVEAAIASAAGLNVNTVLAPVSWDLFEPDEGEYDTTLVDVLLSTARSHELHLILLWFGAWKNGRSTYMPRWVRSAPERFPRAELTSQEHVEHLSPFSASLREADARAFAALMRHLGDTDADQGTVLMVQVENEVGLLGDSRDRSALGERHFNDEVPAQLLDVIAEHPKLPIGQAWLAHGSPRSGTWPQVFGDSLATDEAFMAAAYAEHIQHVAAAGRAEYDLPMFVNAWLFTQLEVAEGTPAGGQEPGTYPSGGPLPHVAPIWRALAPSIDLLAPDVYFGDFEQICRDYREVGGGLFIPEMRRDEHGVGDAFVALGSHAALGVSPFAIDSLRGAEAEHLKDAYDILSQVAPLIANHPSAGIHLHDACPGGQVTLGGFVFTALREPQGDNATFPHGYGLVIEEGDRKFVVAGRGLHLSVRTTSGLQAELVSVEQLPTRDNPAADRRLNGDETLGGTVVILPALGEPTPPEEYHIPTWRSRCGILRVTVAAPPVAAPVEVVPNN